MRTTLSRPAAALQAPEPYHKLIRRVAERRDLSPGAKLLYGALVSQQQMGRRWTQTEIGATIGASRHQVWRWTSELIRAGLLLVKRVGLTMPNLYTLVGWIGRASGGPAQAQQGAGRPGAGPETPFSKKKERPGKQLPGHPVYGFAGLHLPGGG